MQYLLHAGNSVPVPGHDDTGDPQSPSVGGDPGRKVLRRKSRRITGSQRIVSESMSPVWVPSACTNTVFSNGRALALAPTCLVMCTPHLARLEMCM